MTGSQLALFALILAIVALWQNYKLRSHLHIEDQISTPKWRKAAEGPRFEVSPKVDVYPAQTNSSQAAFFKATEKVVTFLNLWYSETRWSFEDEGRLKLEPFMGAERRIIIRHGQQKTGSLRISAIDFGSDGILKEMLTNVARAELEIINARFWPFREVYGIAVSVAGIIAEGDEFEEAKHPAALAALDCLWTLGPSAFGNPDFIFSVSGKGLARLVASK